MNSDDPVPGQAAARPYDCVWAPVAFGRRAVPQLAEQLRRPEGRLRALGALSDLLHRPEPLYQALSTGLLEQLKMMLEDEDVSVRVKTCELLHLLTSHHTGRQALLSSSLLPPLSHLLDDSSSSCRSSVLRVLEHLTLLPAGAQALLPLVPKLMLKLREEEEEEEEEAQVLLLSTLTSCSSLDPLPAVASDGVSLLGLKLTHDSPRVRRGAAATMMALSVCEDGKRRVCEEVLPVVVDLLQEDDVETKRNAAGVIMYTSIITAGKLRCLELNVVPMLLTLVSEQEAQQEETRRRRKALTVFSLRALAALAEAPEGRRLLLQHLPLLERRCRLEEEPEVRGAAQTVVGVVTWRP